MCGLPPKSTLSTRATEKINHTPSASTTTWKKKSISPVAKENEQQKKKSGVVVHKFSLVFFCTTYTAKLPSKHGCQKSRFYCYLVNHHKSHQIATRNTSVKNFFIEIEIKILEKEKKNHEFETYWYIFLFLPLLFSH